MVETILLWSVRIYDRIEREQTLVYIARVERSTLPCTLVQEEQTQNTFGTPSEKSVKGFALYNKLGQSELHGPSVTTPGRQCRGAVVGAEARARRHQKSGARILLFTHARPCFHCLKMFCHPCTSLLPASIIARCTDIQIRSLGGCYFGRYQAYHLWLVG